MYEDDINANDYEINTEESVLDASYSKLNPLDREIRKEVRVSSRKPVQTIKDAYKGAINRETNSKRKRELKKARDELIRSVEQNIENELEKELLKAQEEARARTSEPQDQPDNKTETTSDVNTNQGKDQFNSPEFKDSATNKQGTSNPSGGGGETNSTSEDDGNYETFIVIVNGSTENRTFRIY